MRESLDYRLTPPQQVMMQEYRRSVVDGMDALLVKLMTTCKDMDGLVYVPPSDLMVRICEVNESAVKKVREESERLAQRFPKAEVTAMREQADA